MRTRIVVEYVPDPQRRLYHVTVELTKSSSYERFCRPLRESSKNYLTRLSDVGGQLVRDLIAIDGVKEVGISSYDVRVLKGEAFEWDDMKEGILDAFKKIFAQCNAPRAGGDFR